ncbi:restriction endonuclease [Bacillus sp. ISL-53]|nr:restriction endonuclease [Bacillus sp. ISL-53]
MGRRRKRRKAKGQVKLEWLIIIGIVLFALIQKLISGTENLIYNMTKLIYQFSIMDWSMVAVFIITVVVVIFIFIHGKQTRTAERRKEEELHKQSQRKLNVMRYAEAEKLKSMQPNEFEIYIGDLFSLMGYESRVTPFTGDGGKDIVLRKGKEISIVECKRYNATKVTRPDIQKFHSAIIDMNAKEGFYVTTGYFTVPAIEYVLNKPIILIDLPKLLDLIEDTHKSIV